MRYKTTKEDNNIIKRVRKRTRNSNRVYIFLILRVYHAIRRTAILSASQRFTRDTILDRKNKKKKKKRKNRKTKTENAYVKKTTNSIKSSTTQ